MTESLYHKPVLLTESVDGLAVKPAGTYVDVTYGGGGHSAEILRRLGPEGRLIAFDRDADARPNASQDPRFRLLHHNFRYLFPFLRYYDSLPVDGILADLGISSHQIDQPQRGFSTRYDAPLDMRMDQRIKETAASLLNTMTKAELVRVLRTYGELDHADRIAESLLSYRRQKAFSTTGDLISALEPHTPRDGSFKFQAQVFQALRIHLNDEMAALRSFLADTVQVLRPGGRLVVIAYHSLEDRMVKNFMKTGNVEGEEEKDPIYGVRKCPLRNISKGAIKAGEEEISENNRARSARLRIAEKV